MSNSIVDNNQEASLTFRAALLTGVRPPRDVNLVGSGRSQLSPRCSRAGSIL